MSAERKGKQFNFLKIFSQYGLYIGFLIVFVVFYMKSDYFFTYRNLINILTEVSFVAIIAAGMTFVIITGGIDLSVGSVAALTGVFLVYTMTAWHVPAVVGLLCVLLLTMAVGTFTGGLIVTFNIPPFIATLAMMGVARGFARYIVGDKSIDVKNTFLGFIGEFRLFNSIPFAIILMVVLYIGMYVIARRTRFGRYIYAIGGNAEAVRLSGINTRFVTLRVYIISAILAGLSGILMAMRFSAGIGATGDPKVGDMYELHAIAAVVVGGTSLMGGRGSIFGTLVGALFIGVLNTGLMQLHVADSWQLIIRGIVILTAVLLDQLKNRK